MTLRDKIVDIVHTATTNYEMGANPSCGDVAGAIMDLINPEWERIERKRDQAESMLLDALQRVKMLEKWQNTALDLYPVLDNIIAGDEDGNA